jgi:hypothetical protein
VIAVKLYIDKKELKNENVILYQRIDNLSEPYKGLHIFHFSLDDVIDIFKDLTKNENKYKSIFENETLSYFRNLHLRYGLVLSCFAYFEDGNGFQLSRATHKFRKEFEENADWLKFGFHAYNGNTDYKTETSQKATADYNAVISSLISIVGEQSIDRIIRIHLYHGNKEVIQALKNADYGITGLLGADDDRRQYYFDDIERTAVRHNDYVRDSIMYLTVFSTDLRMEKIGNIDDKLDSVNASQLVSGTNILVCFTHEWALNKRRIKENIERCCQYAVLSKYKFEFLDAINFNNYDKKNQTNY